MKKSNPHLLLSSLLFTAGVFLSTAPVWAETNGTPIGGTVVKGGKNPGGGSFRASPNPGANGMDAVMEALEREELDGNPGGSADQVNRSIVNTTKSNTKDRVLAPSDASAGAGIESGKKGLNAVKVK